METGALPELHTVAELLKQLQAVARCVKDTSARNKRTSRKVRQWVRGLSHHELRRRMTIDPAAAHIKHIFSVLQSLQVMFPAQLGPCGCQLHWGESCAPEVVRGRPEPVDMCRLKHAETKLFNCLFVVWDQEIKGQNSFVVLASSDEIVDILVALSDGKCFLAEPMNHDSISDISWLHNLSRFTFGQYIAGAAELALRAAFVKRIEPIPPRAPTIARSCITQLLQRCTHSRRDVLSLVHQEGLLAMKELMNCDMAMLSFFSTIMKPRVRAADGALTVGYVSSRRAPLLRLWAAASAAQSWRDSLRLLQLHQRLYENAIDSDGYLAVLDSFLNIPFFDMNSFALDHKLRAKERLWSRGAMLMSDRLLDAPESLQKAPQATLSCANKAKIKKKAKAKRSNQKPADNGNVAQLTKRCDLAQEQSALNVPLAPSAVPQRVLDNTHAGIFVSRLIDDIIENALARSHTRQQRVIDKCRKTKKSSQKEEKSRKGNTEHVVSDNPEQWPTPLQSARVKQENAVSKNAISLSDSGMSDHDSALVKSNLSGSAADASAVPQPMRGRVLGSWSFGLSGNLSNDDDITSNFFDVHRNNFSSNASKARPELDRRPSSGAGKKDLIQKFLDDDDFWVAGQADSDHVESSGVYSRVRPWDRRRDMVVLGRLSVGASPRECNEEGSRAAPLYAVLSQDDMQVEVEACLDLRNIPYTNEHFPEARTSEDFTAEDDFDELDDFDYRNVLILSPDSKEASAIVLPGELLARSDVEAVSLRSSPVISTARSHNSLSETSYTDDEVGKTHSIVTALPLLEKKYASGAAGRGNSGNSDSFSEDSDEFSIDSAGGELSSSLVQDLRGDAVAINNVGSDGDRARENTPTEPIETDGAPAFAHIDSSATVAGHRTARAGSDPNVESISDQLKRSIIGLDLSGKAINAALDRHRIALKPKHNPQRRKSGDWQSLQLSKGHGFYVSPNGRRFGRDDSETRHYRRRLIILDTRTPATSPTLELEDKEGDSVGHVTGLKSPGSAGGGVGKNLKGSGALSDAEYVFAAARNSHPPCELEPLIDNSYAEISGIIEEDDNDDESDDSSAAFSASDLSNESDRLEKPPPPALAHRPRGMSDPPTRLGKDLCHVSSGRLPADDDTLADKSVQSSQDDSSSRSDGIWSYTVNTTYLLSSLALLRSQFEASVQVNMLAVQRSIIEYLSSTATTLQTLGPHAFHPGQPPPTPFRQHSEVHFTAPAPYGRFVNMEAPALRRMYKTTEDINSDRHAPPARGFPAPPSPKVRPPLPKAAAPSTLLHTLNQDMSQSRIDDSEFDRLGYNLRRRHSLSGSDNINISIAATQVPLSPSRTPVLSPHSDSSKGGVHKTRVPLPWPKDKDKSTVGDESTRSAGHSEETQRQQQRAAEATVYHNIYRRGEYEGMGIAQSSPLSREIKYFVNILDSYSEAVHRSKLDVLRRIRSCVANLWPRAQAKPFGSFVTGISLPTSDLDIVICLPKVRKEAEPNAPGVLEGRNAIKETWQQKLTQGLMREEWVDTASIRIIPNTAVPVLKFLTKPIYCENGHAVVFSFDVSFEGPGHQGLEANKYILSIIRRYPALRPIVLVLKCFLSRRGLCEAFTGGLSSYVLVLMVARFLQEQTSVKDVGALLLGVLDFYGNHLDPRATGISFARACYFSREMSSVMGPPSHAVSTPASSPGVQPRQSFDRGVTLLSPGLSSHFLNEPYAQTGFSSAPMSPAESVCGDSVPPYFGVSYSEDYIGYVHSTPGEYSHHPGGSVIMSAGAAAIQHHHPNSGGTLHVPNQANASPQQPPLFYKFDPFFVKDPLSRGNNIGRNCFRIYQVQRCWSEALGSICIQIQHLDDMYFEYCEHPGRQDNVHMASFSMPALLEINSMDLSLLRALVGEMSAYRPW